MIIFHNGWTAVNTTRFNSTIILQGDPRTGVFNYKGTHTLDNVFIDEFSTVVF